MLALNEFLLLSLSPPFRMKASQSMYANRALCSDHRMCSHRTTTKVLFSAHRLSLRRVTLCRRHNSCRSAFEIHSSQLFAQGFVCFNTFLCSVHSFPSATDQDGWLLPVLDQPICNRSVTFSGFDARAGLSFQLPQSDSRCSSSSPNRWCVVNSTSDGIHKRSFIPHGTDRIKCTDR